MCRRIDDAKSVLVSRFKSFISRIFKTAPIEVNFENLKFSSINGESGQFLRIEGLNDHVVHVEGHDVLFSVLCSAEGFRITQPKNGVFDLEVSTDVFEEKPISVSQQPGGELTRLTRPALPAITPGSISKGVNDKASALVPPPSVPEGGGKSDDDSMSFSV